MARRATILGIWTLAAAFGSLGYQVLNYWFYDTWQPVTVGLVWGQLFGPWPVAGQPAPAVVAWCGRLPVLAVGVVLAYLCFLVADSVPQPMTPLHRPSLGE
jgi:hypothetical protein